MVLTAKLFKRLFFRKRPSMIMPPRAVFYSKSERTSSFMSQTLLMASMMGWILKGWLGAVTLLAVAFVFKVHSGSIFPSDGLLTVPMCLVNLGMFALIKLLIGESSQEGELERNTLDQLLQIIRNQ